MLPVIIIFSASVILMILSVLIKKLPKYWIVTSAGALVLLASGLLSPAEAVAGLFSSGAVNPVKILVLFISMAEISIFLDEAGFFSYLAAAAVNRASASQRTMFLALYATVSLLTVFTSNDIIILTFTPFICCFAANCRIDPMPYLFAEFVGANTWSMALVIGNPTNIYLAGVSGIGFAEYFRVMALPAAAAGITAFAVLYLLFRKPLSEKIVFTPAKAEINNRPMAVLGLTVLALCTAALVASSYIGIEMWGIALFFFLCLFAAAFCSRNAKPALRALKRAPFELIPFVISMFLFVLALSKYGITDAIGKALYGGSTLLEYGFLSAVTANLVNNIPMSVLFGALLPPAQGLARTEAVYAAIAGSNIGAFLTPIGALAGIMWLSILKNNGIKLSFARFSLYGAATALPTMAVTLLSLYLVF